MLNATTVGLQSGHTYVRVTVENQRALEVRGIEAGKEEPGDKVSKNRRRMICPLVSGGLSDYNPANSEGEPSITDFSQNSPQKKGRLFPPDATHH